MLWDLTLIGGKLGPKRVSYLGEFRDVFTIYQKDPAFGNVFKDSDGCLWPTVFVVA